MARYTIGGWDFEREHESLAAYPNTRRRLGIVGQWLAPGLLAAAVVVTFTTDHRMQGAARFKHLSATLVAFIPIAVVLGPIAWYRGGGGFLVDRAAGLVEFDGGRLPVSRVDHVLLVTRFSHFSRREVEQLRLVLDDGQSRLLQRGTYGWVEPRSYSSVEPLAHQLAQFLGVPLQREVKG